MLFPTEQLTQYRLKAVTLQVTLATVTLLATLLYYGLGFAYDMVFFLNVLVLAWIAFFISIVVGMLAYYRSIYLLRYLNEIVVQEKTMKASDKKYVEDWVERELFTSRFLDFLQLCTFATGFFLLIIFVVVSIS